MTSNKKKALITGITGQIGSYLAELLMEKGYEVYGLIRKKLDEAGMKVHKENGITVFEGDLDDPISIERVIKKVEPDEIYNLAAQSDAQVSFHLAEYTLRINGMALIRICEAARSLPKPARVFQAASAELYGGMLEGAVDENAPFHPRNPYGIAKAYAHMMINCYRESYGMFVCGGILFNHESPRRSLHFVTRKISMGVACIKLGIQNPPVNELGEPMVDAQGRIHLGDLNAMRDWGYSKDYVEAMWLMLQQEKPKDYVIGTDTNYSIKDACKAAFDHVGMNWEDHVMSNERLLRPTEITDMRGDYSLAKKELGWEPKVFMKELMEIMVDADIEWLKSHNVK